MSTAEKEIIGYRKKCWSNYKYDVGIPSGYQYFYGNPVMPLVPIDAAGEGPMFVGAYPTARFATIESIKDVPVGDVHYPFSNEVYFDGSRIRTVQSGKELEHYYLHPLTVQRETCWITNLVKVFLFKDGHIKKYEKLGCKKKLVDRSQFQELAQKSLPFLHAEIKIASPKLIVLLGLETASVVTGESLKTIRGAMDKGEIIELPIGKELYRVIAAPHPGILMRETKQPQHWRTVVKKKTLPRIKELLQ